MLFASRLSLAEQALTLVTSLAEHDAWLELSHAERLCTGLVGRDEKSAAKWLRHELAELRIAVKHLHALRLIGRLAGREGWHGASTEGGTKYCLMVMGVETPHGWDTASDDPKKVLELMCGALRQWARQVDRPRVITLRRNAEELMLDGNPGEADGLLTAIRADQPADWGTWFNFQNYAVERIRRLFVEGTAPVFVDGLTLATLPSDKTEGVRELALYDGAVELGRGTDLHVLELLESETKDDLANARADSNHVRVKSQTFTLMEVYRKLEPLMQMSERTLFHPETEQLLRQYQVFRRKVGKPLAALKLSGRYVAPDGLPREIPVNWEAVSKTMAESKLTPAMVAQRASSTEVGDALLRRPPILGVAPFVQMASALECKDFNTVVRKATWSQAVPADEATLRSVLYAADEIRFVLSADLPPERHARMREAAEELHASRKVREMQMADVIKEPLDEMVFAQDGDEFLAVATDCDAEVRLQVVPAFVTAESLGLVPTENQLPGIGRRLTLLVRPRVSAEARHG